MTFWKSQFVSFESWKIILDFIFISNSKKSFEIAFKCNAEAEKNSHLSQFQIYCQTKPRKAVLEETR